MRALVLSRPIFCPSCGNSPLHGTLYIGEGTFACTCEECKWAGEIKPDEMIEARTRPN